MRKRKALTVYQKSISKWGWLFLGPIIIAFVIGFLWPFIHGLYLSFCEFRLVSEAKFTGFGNYGRAFSDAGFLHSFIFTAIFTAVSMILINDTLYAKSLNFFIYTSQDKKSINKYYNALFFI